MDDMRVFQLQGEWGFDNLTLARRTIPTPGRGEVLVRMKAASLNFRDLVVLDRGYGRATGELPLIPVSDGAGEIAAIGPGVARVKLGDRVCPTFFQSWIGGGARPESFAKSLGAPLDGTMADYMLLSEEGVVRLPAELSYAEAATLPCAALTAWSALVTLGHIKAGDKILVQGTGGVAQFALAFAKIHGAHVTVISSSDDKLARMRAAGADATINYTVDVDWAKAAREIVADRGGFDNIVELGGEKTLPLSLRCVRPGGTISVIGVLSGLTLNASLGPIVARQIKLQGVTVGNRDSFERMLAAIAQHKIKPVLDRRFAFAELKDALSHLKSGKQFGKIWIEH
jgi:NADPH:quinone reductase-like Zn-dependent oxidoreductase